MIKFCALRWYFSIVFTKTCPRCGFDYAPTFNVHKWKKSRSQFPPFRVMQKLANFQTYLPWCASSDRGCQFCPRNFPLCRNFCQKLASAETLAYSECSFFWGRLQLLIFLSARAPLLARLRRWLFWRLYVLPILGAFINYVTRTAHTGKTFYGSASTRLKNKNKWKYKVKRLLE